MESWVLALSARNVSVSTVSVYRKSAELLVAHLADRGVTAPACGGVLGASGRRHSDPAYGGRSTCGEEEFSVCTASRDPWGVSVMAMTLAQPGGTLLCAPWVPPVSRPSAPHPP